MSRGFYTLTSQMLTQQRKMEIASNNIVNSATPGYRKEKAISTTFGTLMLNKVKGENDRQEIIQSHVIKTLDGKERIYSQGSLSPTGSETDFAILGDGFFKLDNGGQPVYTRYGNFGIDNEGYLASNDGRVQGENGDIHIGTDSFELNENGEIKIDGEVVNRLDIYDLNNLDAMVRVGENTFATNEQGTLMGEPRLLNKNLEISNVNYTEELTDIMSSQRALQTAAQALKIYDMIQESASTEIGKVN